MASKTIVTRDCDYAAPKHDSEGHSLHFTIDGMAMEIDLCDRHRAMFDKATAPFVAAAREPTYTPQPGMRRLRSASVRRPRTTDGESSAAIRAWAKNHGYAVGERGRLGPAIKAAYAERDKVSA